MQSWTQEIARNLCAEKSSISHASKIQEFSKLKFLMAFKVYGTLMKRGPSNLGFQAQVAHRFFDNNLKLDSILK
jgi:hypothetical protein